MTNIIFDCDSTLCAIEGIDVLAEQKGLANEVAILTNAAMNGEIALDAIYQKRLDIIQPSLSDIEALGQDYINQLVDDAQYLIQCLLACDCNVFIVSGGLYEPIAILATELAIPLDNVYAVQLAYKQSGNAQVYDDIVPTPLITSHGKSDIVTSIMQKHPGHTLLIGDGSSDAVTKSLVDIFIGYGGIEQRENVESISDVYLYERSLLPLLAFTNNNAIYHYLQNDHRLAECRQSLQSAKIIGKVAQDLLHNFFHSTQTFS